MNWRNLKNLQFEVTGRLSKSFIKRHMQMNMCKLEEEARNLTQASFFIEAVFRCGGWFEVNEEEIIICDSEDGYIGDELVESFKCLWPYVLYIFNEQDLEEYAEERREVGALDRARGSGPS